MAKKQYLQTLREEYLLADKKVKQQLLNEAQKRTGLNRKYLIRRLSVKTDFSPKARRARAPVYGTEVISALVQVWQIYDYICGQRLAPVLKTEVERLRQMKELICSKAVTKKLPQISSATIDRLLTQERKALNLNRYRHRPIHPLLYQKIPVKLSTDWDRSQVGNLQIDFVAHCGQSAYGEFVNTLSGAEIALGWWEARAILGKSQYETNKALAYIKKQLPFPLLEIHPDNDRSFINNLLDRWCTKNKIAFSRSRPNKKNDNAWVEQRNYTHVRQQVGCLRYDTLMEVVLLNSLYRDLSLYKNFCQPTMKLIAKERMAGRIKRKYDTPQTPYQRLLQTDLLSKIKEQELRKTYLSINPAQLKQSITEKQNKLYQFYQQKMRSDNVDLSKKLKPHLGDIFRDVMKPISVT